MDYMPYIQKAYRQIVHDVLETIASDGIDQETALYIAFQTNRPDVILPDFVRARYPEEIMIVLENQFDNLTVSQTEFAVDLAFGGVLSHIVVPFNALIQFADTKSNFGLELKPEPYETPKPQGAKIMSLDELRAAKK